MNGRVDEAGRALLEIDLRATENARPETVDVWIDTGFTGELVLPRSLIERLRRPRSGSTDAILADGSVVTLPMHECYVVWFDELLRLQVVGNEGQYPLLGVGLLLDHDLFVSYQTLRLTVE